MSEAAVYWKVYTEVPSGGIDLLAAAGGIPVQGILCGGAGNLAATHSTPIDGDASETIPAVAGQYFPLRANKILEDTTALPILVLWGYGSGSVITPGSAGGGGDASESTLALVYSESATTNTKLDTIQTDTAAISAFAAQLPDMRAILDSIDGKTPADPASVGKQDEQTALLETIDESTRIGAGWFPKRFHKLLFSDMTGSGIDLVAITPIGRRVVAVMGSSTATSGTIYLEAVENDVGVQIDLNFGKNYIQYGVWRRIGNSTPSTCFPLYVLFS